MKKMVKRLALIGVAALMAATVGVTASAKGHRGVGYQENIQAAANVVGESVESMIDRLQEYRCVGTLMAELGLLEEFQEEKLVLASDRLNEYVENGTMSRETADAALAAIKERQKNCDGTGNGQGNGVCDGTGYGRGNGGGHGRGRHCG